MGHLVHTVALLCTVFAGAAAATIARGQAAAARGIVRITGELDRAIL